ncbi:MAG: hypothetical protein ACYC63_04795 [Armatimonadota bacterium]
MTQGQGTHLVRIYRGALQIQHDLDAIMHMEDVNGQDIFGIIAPLSDTIIDIGPQGIPSGHRCELKLTTDFDIDRGYFVEVKKTRVLDGARVAVEELLTSAVAAGAVEMHLANCVGFRSGDPVIVTDGTHSENSRVKKVAAGEPGSTLEVYEDCSLSRSYATGSKIRASAFFRVIDMPSPNGVGPYKVAVLLQVAARGTVE